LTLLAAACVFIGGGLGACLRWLVSLALNPLSHIVPLGTLAVNLIGGYLIGVAAAFFAHRHDLPPELKLFAITGILGGFTTFSAFSWETLVLARDGHALAALGYVAGSVLGGLAAAVLGSSLAQRFATTLIT
jgi:CrcB protein